MFKTYIYNRVLFSSGITSSVMALLLAAHPLFAQTLPDQSLHSGQEQTGQAGELGTANDFDSDIRLGLQNLTVNSAAQIQQKELQNKEYKSAWGEFGISILVDGAISPTEISKEIIGDVIQTVQTELNYDQQEEAYLETAKITPEEIQTAEGSTDSDVPPGEFINPNPSLEENPDVGAPSIERGVGNITEATSTGGAMEAATTNQEGGTGTEATSTSGAMEPTMANENTIFEAILEGEQSMPPPSETPAPEEASPTE